MIQSVHRSYIGDCFRPQMVTKTTEENTFIGVSSWESSQQSVAILDRLEENLKTQYDDEATKIAVDIDGVSALTNKMVSSLRLTNRYLYISENKEEYKSVAEAVLVNLTGNLVSWALLGDFSLFLKTGKDVFPILVQTSPLFSTNSALPDRCLGLFEKVQYSTGEFRLEYGSSIFIVSKNNLRATEIAKSSFENLDALTNSLVEADPKTPFWVNQLILS